MNYKFIKLFSDFGVLFKKLKNIYCLIVFFMKNCIKMDCICESFFNDKFNGLKMLKKIKEIKDCD